MFTIVYLRGVNVPKLIKSGPRSCWMTSQSMKKSVFFCWDTRPQSCFGVGIEWWNPIGLAIIHFSGIILCPRYLSDRIWPSSQAKSRAVGKSENLEGQAEIDCFSMELLKIWRGTQESKVFQWNRVFIYFLLNLRERLTPLHGPPRPLHLWVPPQFRRLWSPSSDDGQKAGMNVLWPDFCLLSRSCLPQKRFPPTGWYFLFFILYYCYTFWACWGGYIYTQTSV